MYNGLAIPVYGNASMYGQTAADTVLTIQGASAQSGRYMVIQTSAAVEKFAIGATNFTHKFVMGTVALASLSSNASVATATLTGLTTDMVIQIFGTVSTPLPTVYVNAADKIGYAPPGSINTAAMTVNYLAWLTV